MIFFFENLGVNFFFVHGHLLKKKDSMDTSVRESLTVTISTNCRNKRNYPDTNDFVVDLPVPVPNVVNLSLQRMEMNLSQNPIRKGVNDRIRFREGLRLGGDHSSTTFRIVLEGDTDNGTNPNARLSLPSYLNPVMSRTGNDIFLYRPGGFRKQKFTLKPTS